MAIGLYKQGQGYWVRMLTAIGAGILFLAAAAWVWQSIARINPPSIGMNVSIAASEGALPAEGAQVEFLADGESAPLATGVVRSATPEGQGLTLDVRQVTLSQDARRAERDVTQAQTVRTGTGFSGDIPAQGFRPIPAFDMTYVQTGAAGLVILAGAVLIYIFVGQRPKSAEFLIAADIEGRKVNWSTRKEVIGSTWVVIGAMFLIAGTLFIIDLLFQTVFSAIDVLQR